MCRCQGLSPLNRMGRMVHHACCRMMASSCRSQRRSSSRREAATCEHLASKTIIFGHQSFMLARTCKWLPFTVGRAAISNAYWTMCLPARLYGQYNIYCMLHKRWCPHTLLAAFFIQLHDLLSDAQCSTRLMQNVQSVLCISA